MSKKDIYTVSKYPESKQYKHPLVFLHGMFEGSWIWEEHFLDYFVGEGFECHAINLKGHNGRPEKIRFLSINDYIDDLSAVIGRLEEKPIVIAHSMGGFILQKYLEKNSLPFAVLIAPVGSHGLIQPTLKVIVKRPHRFLLGLFILSLQPIVNDRGYMKRLMYTTDMNDERYEKFYQKAHNESFRAFLDMIFIGIKHKEVQTPLEILGFENDFAVKASAVVKTAKKYNRDAKIFGDFGHHPMLRKNWEEVANYILYKIREFED